MAATCRNPRHALVEEARVAHAGLMDSKGLARHAVGFPARTLYGKDNGRLGLNDGASSRFMATISGGSAFDSTVNSQSLPT